MGRVHPQITAQLRDFISAQHVFFVATAPLGAEGHVNVSPKGVDGTSLVVDGHTFAYLDITASGAETVAHLRENGRITVMFCAFEGKPKVVRLHGYGRAVRSGTPEFADWFARFEGVTASPAHRAVIVVDVTRVSDSCGFGVPFMRFEGERRMLVPYAERHGAEGVRAYQHRNNLTSIDNLPALTPPDTQHTTDR
jgi:hypothetical protein